MSKLEKRFLATAELRAESQGDECTIVGYAALFGSPSKNLGGFIEQIAPSAFDRALREKQVVRFTFNHSLDHVLARTDNGSLQLSTDKKGLRFKAQLQPQITAHKDLWEACKSGLYTECSFAFTVPAGGETWSPDGTTRTLLDVDLHDCALVGVPAYSGTSANARAAGTAEVEARNKRLADCLADSERHSKGMAILEQVMRDDSANDDEEENGNDDFFSMRENLQNHIQRLYPYHDYRLIGHNDTHAYAMSVNAPDDCVDRWSYERDSKGNLVLDNRQRFRLNVDEVSSLDGRALNAVLEERALYVRMRAAAGISTR